MAKTVSEWILETGSAQSNLQDLIRDVDNYKGKVGTAADAGKKAFTESTKAATDFNRELANGTKIYQKVQNSAAAFKDEQKRLNSVLIDLKKNQKQFIAEGRYKELQQNIEGVKNRIKELNEGLDDGGKKSNKFADMVGKVGAAMAAYFAIDTVINLGKQILDVTASFQKFEAVLTTSLGSSSAAERAMNMISDFAAKTPYSVEELTDSYVKLAGRGIRATSDEMTALGDIAAASGKSFDQLTEAVLDAMSGENERLKEFGITAQKTGATTQYTFKGVTTEVNNTKEAVQAYLISIGQAEGVSGSMAAISETLTGKISNLGDSFDQLLLTMGNQGEGVFSGLIDLTNELLQGFTALIATTDQLGEKMAAKGVSDYALKVEGDFKSLAEKTKAAGGDVETTLKAQAESLKKDLAAKQKLAEQNLAAFRKEQTILSKAGEWLDMTGVQRAARKGLESALASSVSDAKGKTGAVDDALRYALAKTPAAAPADDKAAKAAAKKAADDLKRAKAELERLLADLEKQAAKARLDMLDKNSKEYQDELYKQREKEIDIVEKTIREAEKKAGKDGKIDPKQAKQLSLMRAAAWKDYADAIAKIDAETNEKVLNLQADSDEKQLALIKLGYRKQINEARDAKNERLAIALEQARDLELVQARLAQKNKRLDFQETVAIEGVKSVANSDVSGADPADLERAKQQAILDIQIEFAQKRLDVLAGETSEESVLRRMQLGNLIQDLNKQKEDIAAGDKFNMMDLLGVDEDDRDEVKQAFGEVIGFLSEYTAQQLEYANMVVEKRQEDVDQKEEDLDREIELNKLGFASNVETKRAELEEARKQKAQALEDQRKAQKAQNAIDTMNQTVGLITSSVNIINGFSKIPIIGLPLGIAAVAAMFAGFVAMKARAASMSKMEHGGLLGGKRHSEGGNKFIAADGSGLEHEEGEFFTNRKATRKYLNWLEAINKDDEDKLADLAIAKLLADAGIAPARKLPKRIQNHSAAYQAAKTGIADEKLMKQFKRQEEELVKIRKNTTSEGLLFEDEEKKVVKFGNVTQTIRKSK